MAHKFYKDWDKFWDFYIKSVEKDVGKFAMASMSFEDISKKLSLISPDEVRNKIEPIVRELGHIPDSIVVDYNPNMTTFYSHYDRDIGRFRIGYPTFTRWMIYWAPAVKAAFRHEMGHILRGDCIDPLGAGECDNANTCMDIRINQNIPRLDLEQVYDCLYFKTNRNGKLLVPEVEFPRINLDYNPEAPYVPGWRTILDFYDRANDIANAEQPPPPPPPKKEFQIGDYVIINDVTSENNGKPGKIVDKIKGEWLIEAVSEEEAIAIIEQMKRAKGMFDEGGTIEIDGDLLGTFESEELLPLQPPPEGGSCAGGSCPKPPEKGKPGKKGKKQEPPKGGQPGQPGEPPEGGEPGDPPEGGEPGGEKPDTKKGPLSNEERIKAKEELLDELRKAGLDGTPNEKPIISSSDPIDKDYGEDDDTDEEQKKTPAGKGEPEEQEGEEQEGEEQEGEGTEGEEKEGEEKEGEEKGGEQKQGEPDLEGEMTDAEKDKERQLDEEIEKIQFDRQVKQSIGSLENIKNTKAELLTDGEAIAIDKAISDLNNLL